MLLYLDQQRTLRLVNELHGGLDELAAAWEERSEEDDGFPKAKQRATIYRWIAEGLPSRKSASKRSRDDDDDIQSIALCSLLDVDPLSILDFRRSGYFSNFAKLRQLIYLGGTLGGLLPIFNLLRPADEWPNGKIAERCYGRSWCSRKFSNSADWKSENYILVRTNFIKPSNAVPRAVHIAYRRILDTDTMWRYYGTVIAVDGKLRLYNESGDFQEMDAPEIDEIRFRTYFGGRPVEWCIASIHDFKFSPDYPHNDMSTIGFNW